MAVIITGLVLCVLDSSMLHLALPVLARQWQVDAAQTLWVVNANQVASLVLLLPLAALGDRLGYKRVYLWGMLVFGVASVMAALAPSLSWLVVARALQGMGMAGVLSVNPALVRQIFPRHLLGRGMALNSMVVALSTVLGPVLAAAVLSVVDWRWLFCLHLPLACWIVWLGRRALPQPQARPALLQLSKIDVLLNITMFAACFVALDRISHASSSHGWGATALWLAAGIAAGVCYVRRQQREAAPMLPLDLLRLPVFRLSMAASVMAFSAQTVAFLVLPFLLMDVHGVSTAQTGMLISAWPLALALAAPWVGRQIGRIPAGQLGGLGMALFAVGLVSLACMPIDASSWNVVLRMALCGVGFALFQSPNNHTIVMSAPAHRSGAASGMQGTARHTGQGLGAVSLAACLMWGVQQPGAGEQRALWLAAAYAVLAAVCSVLRHPPGQRP